MSLQEIAIDKYNEQIIVNLESFDKVKDNLKPKQVLTKSNFCADIIYKGCDNLLKFVEVNQ